MRIAMGCTSVLANAWLQTFRTPHKEVSVPLISHTHRVGNQRDHFIAPRQRVIKHCYRPLLSYEVKGIATNGRKSDKTTQTLVNH